jgi:hypothetical protein
MLIKKVFRFLAVITHLASKFEKSTDETFISCAPDSAEGTGAPAG